jgi:hypothetical protein
MAAQHSASSNGAALGVAPGESPIESPVAIAEPPNLSTAERKARLAEVLVGKTEQGYEIESQTDTEAILVTKGRRRWFGMGGNNASTRLITSIDEQGNTRTRSG